MPFQLQLFYVFAIGPAKILFVDPHAMKNGGKLPRLQRCARSGSHAAWRFSCPMRVKATTFYSKLAALLLH